MDYARTFTINHERVFIRSEDDKNKSLKIRIKNIDLKFGVIPDSNLKELGVKKIKIAKNTYLS